MILLLACWEPTATDSGFVDLPEDTAPVLEVIGDYVGSDGSVVVITSTSWRTDDRTDAVLDFSNSSDTLTAEAGDGTFARYDWRSEGGQWWVCRSADGLETAQDAADAERAPDDDCLGAEWASLTLAP